MKVKAYDSWEESYELDSYILAFIDILSTRDVGNFKKEESHFA